MTFITRIADLPCSVFEILTRGLMSSGHHCLHCGKWKHCDTIVFIREMSFGSFKRSPWPSAIMWRCRSMMGLNENCKTPANWFWLSPNVNKAWLSWDKTTHQTYCSATLVFFNYIYLSFTFSFIDVLYYFLERQIQSYRKPFRLLLEAEWIIILGFGFVTEHFKVLMCFAWQMNTLNESHLKSLSPCKDRNVSF